MRDQPTECRARQTPRQDHLITADQAELELIRGDPIETIGLVVAMFKFDIDPVLLEISLFDGIIDGCKLDIWNVS